MGASGDKGSVEIRMAGGRKAPVVAGVVAVSGAVGAALGVIGGRRRHHDRKSPDGADSTGGAGAAGRKVEHTGLPPTAAGVVSKDASRSPADERGGQGKNGKNANGKAENVKAWVTKLDGFQQTHTWAAIPYAVIKKFGDDEAGNLAALIAYYGIGSLFPLLLVFLTVLGFVLSGNPDLQARVLHSTFSQFPIVGDQIQKNVHSLHGSGIGLAIGLVGTFYGGLGVANAAQNALNRVWEVPHRERPKFVNRVLRSLLLIVVVGGGIIGTSVLTGMGSGSGVLGFGFRAVVLAISVVLNMAIFALAFRVLTVRDVPWKRLLPGAVLAGVAWQILQAVGGYYVSHGLKGASQSYGFFAVVLGLMSWLYLEAQLMLLAAEVNVVLAGRLWPRSITEPQRTEADKRAFAAYAEVEERQPDEDVDVGFQGVEVPEDAGVLHRVEGPATVNVTRDGERASERARR